MLSRALGTAGDGLDVRRIRTLRLAVFLFGFAIAVLSAFVIWRHQTLTEHTEDPFSFAKIAASALRGDGMVLHIDTPVGPAPHWARRAPAYPSLIAVIFAIGGERLAWVQFVQTLLAGAICVLIFQISLRLFGNVRASVLAAGMYAVHPMLLRYVPDIQVEILLTFFFTLAAWLSLRFIEQPSIVRGLCLGFSIAAAAMTKPVALPYSLFFVATYLGSTWLESRRAATPFRVQWPALAAIFVAMALVILPWSYRNYRVMNGHFVLISTNGGGEFIRGYIFAEPDYYLLRKGATTDAESRANHMETELFAAQGKVWEANEVENDVVLSHAARQQLLSAPLALVKKTAINFFMYWYVATNKLNSLLIGSLSLTAWFLAFIAIRRARSAHLLVWPVLVPILSLNFTYAVVLALARYSAPTIPLLMVLAGFGLDTLLRKVPSYRTQLEAS